MTRFFKLCYCVNWEGGVLFSWFNLLKKKIQATNKTQETNPNNKAFPSLQQSPFSFPFPLKPYSSMNETSPNNCIPPLPRELTYFISVCNEKNKYQNLSNTVASILLPLHYYFFKKLILESCRLQFPALCRRSPNKWSEFTCTPTPHTRTRLFFFLSWYSTRHYLGNSLFTVLHLFPLIQCRTRLPTKPFEALMLFCLINWAQD